MYRKIVIVLLLAGYVSAQSALTTINSTVTSGTDQRKATGHVSTPTKDKGVVNKGPPPQEQERIPQIPHDLSETEITLIVLAVIAGIIGIIVGIAFAVHQMRKKRALDVQSLPSHDTGVPLSSIETGNPEK